MTTFAEKLFDLIREHNTHFLALEAACKQRSSGLIDEKEDAEHIQKIAACELKIFTHLQIDLKNINEQTQNDLTEAAIPPEADNAYISELRRGCGGDAITYIISRCSLKLIKQTLHLQNMLAYKGIWRGSNIHDYAAQMILRWNLDIKHPYYLPSDEELSSGFIRIRTNRGWEGIPFSLSVKFHFQLYSHIYRWIIGFLAVSFIAALMFSPLGPAVLGTALIGAVAWASTSAWAIIGGIVTAFSVGTLIALFDYALASLTWIIAESLIGLLSLPALFCSTFAMLGLFAAQEGLRSCAHACGMKITFEFNEPPDHFLIGILLVVFVSPLAVFALPVLLFASIVELAERINCTAWIHRSVMTIRNLFSRQETEKSHEPQKETDDFKLLPLKDATFFAFFEKLTANEATYCGNVSKRLFLENPHHKHSSEPPVVTTEDFRPQRT